MFIERHLSSIAAMRQSAPDGIRKERAGRRLPRRGGHRVWLWLAAGAALPVAALVSAGGARASVRPAASAVTGTRASLTAVTAIPGSSGAWAVGEKCPEAPEGCVPGNDEILRASAGKWSQVAAPSPGGQASLRAVSADSTSDAWAVGSYDGGEKNLYLRWSGSVWKRVSGPGGFTVTGVAAISRNDALVVGYVSSPSEPVAVSLRWNGSSWKRVAIPHASGDTLLAVTAIPGTSGAWATGSSLDPQSTSKTLIMRWNGSEWSQIPSPPVTSYATQLAAVAAVSARDAWAVGQSGDEIDAYHPLILHWSNGAWSQEKLPSSGQNRVLYGVAATVSEVWAVGYGPCVGPSFACPSKALTMHLTSSGWQLVPGISFSDQQDRNTLSGVAITTARDVWAVGDYFPPSEGEPIFALLENQQGPGWATR